MLPARAARLPRCGGNAATRRELSGGVSASIGNAGRSSSRAGPHLLLRLPRPPASSRRGRGDLGAARAAAGGGAGAGAAGSSGAAPLRAPHAPHAQHAHAHTPAALSLSAAAGVAAPRAPPQAPNNDAGAAAAAAAAAEAAAAAGASIISSGTASSGGTTSSSSGASNASNASGALVPGDVLRQYEHKLEGDAASVGLTLAAVTGVIVVSRTLLGGLLFLFRLRAVTTACPPCARPPACRLHPALCCINKASNQNIYI